MSPFDTRVFREVRDFLAWWAVIGVVPLPALSYAGYPASSLEYCLTVVAAAVLGAICFLAGRIKTVARLALLFLAALAVLTYFGRPIAHSLALTTISSFAGLMLGLIVWLDFRRALWIVGVAGAAQIATVAVTSTTVPASVHERTGAIRSNKPPIIHLILDEHAGTGSIPDDAVSEDDRRNLESAYVSRGFVVFRRDYSADRNTAQSIARLLNPRISDPNDALQLLKESQSWRITKAEALQQISKDRMIEATYFDFVAFGDQVLRQEAFIRVTSLNANVSYPSVARLKVSMPGRLVIVFSQAALWLYSKAESPLIGFLRSSEWAERIWTKFEPIRRTYPLISRDHLLNFIQYIRCCGKAGTYYYVHYYLPHYPYVFDSQCRTRSPLQWLDRIVTGMDEKDTLTTRLVRYRLHFAQAQCVARDMGALIDAVEANNRLKGAVLIVHSDHGSRIAIEDQQTVRASGYNHMTYEQDWRGGFFAVRIPGVPAGVVEEPARIDLIYDGLLSTGFRTINPESTLQAADSPF